MPKKKERKKERKKESKMANGNWNGEIMMSNKGGIIIGMLCKFYELKMH